MSYRIATLLACLSISVFAQDPWKGGEYAKNSESQKSSADDFLKATQLQGVDAILDVGCGDGKVTAALARAIPQGSVIGVDVSPSMIETAKIFTSKNLTFQVQDAAQLDFDSQFDLITSFTVMQWVLEQSQALQCFEKALKPGGKLWIQMPIGLPMAMHQALEISKSLNQGPLYSNSIGCRHQTREVSIQGSVSRLFKTMVPLFETASSRSKRGIPYRASRSLFIDLTCR